MSEETEHKHVEVTEQVAESVAEQAHEEPQPEAPKADKAEKSNKADKSADDKDEGLARFYDAPMDEYPTSAKVIHAIVACAAGGFTKIVWPWTIENGERIWDAKEGQVIVMNHVSLLDPVIMVCSEWYHKRKLRTVYKSEWDKVAPLKFLFARCGAFPVKRGTADLKAVRRSERALKRGEDLLIYPEGTRIRTDDQEVEIHGGFALIARLAKAPVVPVAIVGARDITPEGTHFKRLFWHVYVRVGEPIRFEDLKSKGKKAQTEEMERLAMERVYELRDQLRKEHPGKH